MRDAVDWVAPTLGPLAAGSLAMLPQPGSRIGYRRTGVVFAQIERLAPRYWQVTSTVMQPGRWVPDETIPIIDLGTFRTSEDACDAADLILGSWNWTDR